MGNRVRGARMTLGGVRSLFNANNVRVVANSLRNDGAKVTFRRVRRALSDCFEDGRRRAYSETPVPAGPPAEVPFSESPLVSVIIPVYNQYEYTAACLSSIAENDDGIPMEIIIGDDGSTDETASISEKVHGLAVVGNGTNLGFTLNCNRAVGSARGKYLLFLNNDTLVHKGWLGALVELMESDPSIGIAGSKFVYPNGTLQEAGGILWSDGSAWNYGRGSDPDLPEFNYVRDVDYISGASLMIPRALFEEIGGFDGRYAPAYCEDSDLAFEVRKRGYRVVYQPRSVVTHFEGMSNGKTVASGLKAYQIRNTRLFYEKWERDLKCHNPSGADLFHARDRSAGKKTVLVVDYTVPRYDDNAGARTVHDCMRLMVAMGYNVKFIPQNFWYDPDYTPIYQGMGIEVLYGNKYCSGWMRWISDNGDNIDCAMIFRPEVARTFLRYIKANSRAKVIYNVADLHYLRLRRQYDVSGDARFKRESERYEKEEVGFMRESDLSVTVSSDEARIMESIVGTSKVARMPIYCYDRKEPVREVKDGRGFLFVGSFNHPPNRDAVRWMVEEIMPIVAREEPGFNVTIVGSNAPEDLLALSGENVRFVGRISDEALSELYRTCAGVVAPLRFGAGVKGKTVEAMRYGAPIVATSIALEGIDGLSELVPPRDDAASFASAIVELIRNPSKGEDQAKSWRGLFEREFSVDAMKSSLLEILRRCVRGEGGAG